LANSQDCAATLHVSIREKEQIRMKGNGDCLITFFSLILATG